MNWTGKVVGGAVGLVVGGPFGALFGAALGHVVDNRVHPPRYRLLPFFGDHKVRAQGAFFAATFSVMGCLAKADGRVSRSEIDVAEKTMARMELDAEMRAMAIQLFADGKQADFPLDKVLTRFRRETRGHAVLLRMFLEIQLAAAFADGEPNEAERRLLVYIRDKLNVRQRDFDRIERFIRADRRFSRSKSNAGSGARSTRATLSEAYAVLDLAPTASIDEIKTGYRRLLSQHHPDKLVARGLPGEMMKLAAQKTHEIKSAYEQIRRQRGF